VTYGTTGAASPGDSGGTNANYSNFSPGTWGRLYWGPSSASLPQGALDGTLDPLTFTGISGTTATWQGNTSWTNPGPGTVGPHTVPVRMVITITGLGSNPWVLSTSVPTLDPGIGTGIGAVVANHPTAVNFTANVQFLADIPTDGSGYIPLNTIRQGTGGNTRSSFTGAFYSAP
jgi:hypothetical protein